ncbi:MAG TPA: MarR family transcriptional regulator [Chloroflexaceae bacterium]|nr:MarR family transcriptional regulator [Chloroflexaceae bacterium]
MPDLKPSIAHQQHRLIHDIYVLLDDGDRHVLETLSLSPLEFAVLQRLSSDQGRRLTDIGAELLCVKSTITRVVDRLEADGLALRTPDPDDRRAQCLLLTMRGAAVRERAAALHDSSVERRMALLTADEQRDLCALLEKLRDGLRQGLVEGD